MLYAAYETPHAHKREPFMLFESAFACCLQTVVAGWTRSWVLTAPAQKDERRRRGAGDRAAGNV